MPSQIRPVTWDKLQPIQWHSLQHGERCMVNRDAFGWCGIPGLVRCADWERLRPRCRGNQSDGGSYLRVETRIARKRVALDSELHGRDSFFKRHSDIGPGFLVFSGERFESCLVFILQPDTGGFRAGRGAPQPPPRRQRASSGSALQRRPRSSEPGGCRVQTHGMCLLFKRIESRETPLSVHVARPLSGGWVLHTLLPGKAVWL